MTYKTPKIERMCVPFPALNEFLEQHRKKQSEKDEDLPLKVQEEQTSPSNDGEMYEILIGLELMKFYSVKTNQLGKAK